MTVDDVGFLWPPYYYLLGTLPLVLPESVISQKPGYIPVLFHLHSFHDDTMFHVQNLQLMTVYTACLLFVEAIMDWYRGPRGCDVRVSNLLHEIVLRLRQSCVCFNDYACPQLLELTCRYAFAVSIIFVPFRDCPRVYPRPACLCGTQFSI